VVDAVAPSAADASLQGRNAARLVGAQRLIERLTLPEGRASARSPLEASAVAQLYRSYQTQGEMKSSSVSGGIRATGLVTWTFEEDRVRAYLDQRGVAYVDNQAATSLIVPVAAANVNAADWGAWVIRSASGVTGKSDETSLAPYVGSTQSWTQRPTTNDIQAELTRTRAEHGVIAEAYMQGPQYYVRLTDMRPTVPNPVIGVVGPLHQPVVRSIRRGVRTRTRLENGVRRALHRRDQRVADRPVRGHPAVDPHPQGSGNSRLVRDLNVDRSRSPAADITFSYGGRPEQLASDLRSRGVDIRNAPGGGWVLLVAGARW